MLNAPPPPENYQPGSTYVPPQDRGLQNAPPPPSATPRQEILPVATLPKDAPIQDRIGGQILPGIVNDFATSVQEFADQPGVMDKLGNVAGVANVPFEKERNRLGRRGIDLATTGSSDTTLGAITDILGHPENVADSLPWDVVNSTGNAEKDYARWVQAHPEAVQQAVESGDDGMLVDLWLAGTGQTFDSGVLGGVEGLARQVGMDPLTPATIGVSAGFGTAARAANLAGKTGLARGIVRGEKVAQLVMDPAGTVAEEAVRGVAPRIPGIGRLLQPSAATQQTQATDLVNESLRAAAQERRNASAATGGMSYPDLAPEPPPQVPLGLPERTGPEDVIVGMGPSGPMPETPYDIASRWWQTRDNVRRTGQPVVGMDAPGQSFPDLAGRPRMSYPDLANPPLAIPERTGAANLIAMNGAPGPPTISPDSRWWQAVPGRSFPDLAQAPRPSRKRTGSPAQAQKTLTQQAKQVARDLPPLQRTEQGWVLADGSRPGQDALAEAYRAIERANPSELRSFAPGRVVKPSKEARLSQYLAAMTENGSMYDDWPANRVGPPAKMQAGRQWTELFSKRIATFQKQEVDRLVQTFHNDAKRILSGDVLPHERHADYLRNRAEAIADAAQKAGYTGDVDLRLRPTDAPARSNGARPVPPAKERAPLTGQDINAALNETLSGVSNSRRSAMSERVRAMWDDPDGITSDAHKATRQELYKSGAWSKEQYPRVVGYRRRTRFMEAHEAFHQSRGTTGDVRARRGTAPAEVYGTLTPQQQAIADGVAQEFRAHLDSMGLGHIRLGLVDYISEFDPATGTKRQLDWFAEFNPEQQSIDLSINHTMGSVLTDLDARLGPNWAQRVSDVELSGYVKQSLYQSLNHEALHALRSMQVITDDEWRLLANEAHSRGYGRWASDNYADLSAPMQDEEAIAELFGDFARNQAMSSQSRSILQKVVDFFTGFVRATGRNDAEGVMRRMLSGDVGGRGSLFDTLPDELLPRQARRGRFSGSILRQQEIEVTSRPGEFDGLMIPDPIKAFLRNKITFNDVETNLYDVGKKVGNDVEHLRFLATQHAQTPLTGRDLQDFNTLKRQFEPYEPRYDWDDPNFTTDEVDRLASAHTTDLWVKENYPNTATRPTPGVLGRAAEMNRDVMAFRRRMGLTNIVAAPRQFVVQALGNVMGFGITRPDVITEMFKPGAYGRAVRSARDPRVLTDSQQFFKDMGFAPGSNAAIETGAKALTRNATGMQSQFLNKVADIFAPKWAGELASAPDDVARGGLARKTYIPGMRREQDNLHKHAIEVLGAYGRTRAMPAIAPEELERVVRDALAAKKLRGDPISRLTGQDLEKAILDTFSDRAGVGSLEAKSLRDFADRVGRDYNNVRNTQRQMAGAEANRVLFSWDDTNLDAFLKNFTLYHYWALNATGLYLKEMIKKPAMGAAMVRLGQALQAEAERNNYPNWMKWYTRLLNSPAGVTLMASLTDLLGTMVMFADWQMGTEPLAAQGDMTMLGTALGVAPLFFGPLVQYGAYLTGAAGGEDARIPGNITGLEPVFTRAAQIINLANVNGHLPPGMLRDNNGNPVLLDTHAITNVLQKFGVAFFGRAPLDLDAGFKAKQKFYLQDELRRAHPEWANDPDGENELTRTVNDMEQAALAGDPSPEWLEAERMAVQESLTGPEFPGLPEPLRAILGGVIRTNSPISITSMPETKAMEQYGFGNIGRATMPDPNDPTGQRQVVVPHALGTSDEFDKVDLKGRAWDTLDMALLQAANEDWWEVGTDTGLRDAARMFSAIGRGDLSSTETAGRLNIAGTEYSSAQLAEMTERERYRLAETWLNSQGYTVADKDAYYEARDEIAKLNPDVGGLLAYKEHIATFPGGAEQFVNEAMRSSPSFARYMQQLPYAPGTEDWYGAADASDAYFAIEGRRSSIYDPTTLPDRGVVPGLAQGESFAQRYAVQQALDDATSAEGGDGNGFDDFVSEVDKNVANLYHAQRLWNETFPGWSLRVGMDFIDNSGGAYDYIKTVWEENGVYPPDKGDIAYEYYWEWLPSNATATDHSVRSFLNQREDSGSSVAESEPVTPEMIAAQLGIPLVNANPAKLTDTGSIDTSQLQRVTPSYDVEMRTSPSTNSPASVIALGGQPMWVTDIEGEWAQIVTLGNEVGWVPTTALMRAA